jgi:shikimate kinase
VGETAGHLILVGLPGAGKSTVGPLVAATLGRQFLDLDAELERRDGRSVAAQFAADGEPAFRAREAALSAELATVVAFGGAMVLAPGGGWLANLAASTPLRPLARLVYLRVTPAVAAARLGDARRSRPLLAGGDPVAALEALLARRRAAYEAADHVVDVDALTPAEAAQAIVAALARPVPSPHPTETADADR